MAGIVDLHAMAEKHAVMSSLTNVALILDLVIVSTWWWRRCVEAVFRLVAKKSVDPRIHGLEKSDVGQKAVFEGGSSLGALSEVSETVCTR